MHRTTIIGVIGLALVCVLCPWHRAPEIEAQVRAAALECADDVGADHALISVSGRDVTLAGPITSEALSHHLTSCIAAYPGIRTIDNRLEVLRRGALAFRTGYDDITLSGVVPSAAAKTALIDRAMGLWGSANVTDALEVDPRRTIGGWSDDDFALFLAALRHSRRDLDIELSDGRAVVGGTVLSNLAKIRVLGSATALLPDFEIVDRLAVREAMDPRETLQAALDTQLDGRVVEFETDSANLTPNGRRVLDDVIEIIRDRPGRIEISGHTDSSGAMGHNLELSQRRAEAVERYFVAKGLDPDRFDTVGYGPTRPVAPNTTSDGQQMNRRTEFHALEEN